jgi:PleD family two-component response regulator
MFSSLPGLWTARPFAPISPPVVVLIIDDDGDSAQALAAALDMEGFRTVVARNGGKSSAKL